MRPPPCELPPGQAKCLPRVYCPQATQCAGWLVPMVQGMPVGDFSVAAGWKAGACTSVLDAAAHRRKAPAGPLPRVLDAPGWVR